MLLPGHIHMSNVINALYLRLFNKCNQLYIEGHSLTPPSPVAEDPIVHGPQLFHSESRDFGDYSQAFLSQLTEDLYIYSCQSNLIDLFCLQFMRKITENYNDNRVQSLVEGLFGICSLDVVKFDDSI